jgi:DDE superfamily endonuclease
LKRWGIQFAKHVGLLNFKASNFWLLCFKRKHKIVSRKITKFCTNINIESPKVLKEKADEFVASVRQKMNGYQPKMIFNSDQSSFSYLIKSIRMHTIKGEKSVLAKVDSEFKRTHSYTIQPIITANGTLAGKVLIVLQENGMKFGPQVQKKVDELQEKCKNVIIMCSKSGKLHKEHVKIWVDTVLSPLLTSKSILLLDSWRGQKDEELYESISKKDCSILTIPEKTTGYCQPLDVYGFRQWKAIIRKITSRMDLDESSVDLTCRANIIILQSLIHNQLSRYF